MKNEKKLILLKATVKNLKEVRTGIKTGLASQQCRPPGSLSVCRLCPQ